MKTVIHWWNQIHRAWYWRQIQKHKERMHALLKQWQVWKQQYSGMQMVANDYYFHNLYLQTKRREWLFKKIRQYKVA